MSDADSLKKIAEDAFLLAANIRTGGHIDIPRGIYANAAAYAAAREWRVVELVVDLGERIVEAAGIPHEDVRTPTAIRDLLDGDYALEPGSGD